MANSWIMALKHWNSMKGGKYKVPKKGTKDYDEVKKVQASMIKQSRPMVNGDGLIQLGKSKAKQTYGKAKQESKQTYGGSLTKALNLAKDDPKQFVKIVNKLTKTGSGMKKQTGGFLPAFIVPFIPSIVSALSTAAGAFATGAAGAAGAALVDEIVGDGLIQLGKAKQTSGKKKGNGLKQSKAKKIRPKKGNGLLDMALSNPQETMDISKVLSGAYMPPPPKIVDGKLQIQKGPIDNLLSSIFG